MYQTPDSIHFSRRPLEVSAVPEISAVPQKSDYQGDKTHQETTYFAKQESALSTNSTNSIYYLRSSYIWFDVRKCVLGFSANLLAINLLKNALRECFGCCYLIVEMDLFKWCKVIWTLLWKSQNPISRSKLIGQFATVWKSWSKLYSCQTWPT